MTQEQWKHTGNNGSLNNYGEMVHADGEQKPLCTIYGKNAKSRARLIAAAPKLLSTLSALYDDLDNNGEIFGSDKVRMEVIQEAINEAMGPAMIYDKTPSNQESE